MQADAASLVEYVQHPGLYLQDGLEQKKANHRAGEEHRGRRHKSFLAEQRQWTLAVLQPMQTQAFSCQSI